MAVLAGLIAKEAQGATEATQTSDQVCVKEDANQCRNINEYIVYVVIVILTIVTVKAFDGARAVLRPSPREQQQQQPQQRRRRQCRDVASQAQCTYTAVRKATNPRFQVLPEFSQE